jgi:chemotaxis protein methyltransferase CheR
MDTYNVTDKISKADFAWLQAWLFERSSIVLEDARKFLAEKRLAALLFQAKAPDIAQLLGRLRAEPDSALGAEVLEALTQSETWFFRDMPVFTHLIDEAIPTLRRAVRGRKLRVWSAACSTGQEAYSLAMALAAKLGPTWHEQVEITASDLSARQVAHARDGAYNRDEVNRGLPAMYLSRYFTQLGTRWHIEEGFREQVRFETLRLDQPWDARESYDLVLLRNVLFYFNEETRMEVLWRVRQQLCPNGLLVLGSSEKSDLTEGFNYVDQGKLWYYQRSPLPTPSQSYSFNPQLA